MFLHLGNNISVPVKDIVAILNKDSLDVSKDSSMYIKNLDRAGNIRNNSLKNEKSYVVVCPRKLSRGRKMEEECFVYLSNISSTTLLKRYKEKIGLEVE